MQQTLPIDAILPDLLRATGDRGLAVVQAPPGAGKTTRVPLALHLAGQSKGRIVMLEPRRLAARAAAERLAEQLGEATGQTVGYRMRGETKVGPKTKIEVVTEGILTRMIQSDPELAGIGAVIFDEFHERSLNADLGLALAWEVRQALRPDLILIVMSATLDAGPVAAMLDDAPVITSEGRAYPVDIRHLDAPSPRDRSIEQVTAELVRRAVAETGGGVLVFLPGEAEIRRTEALLTGRLPAGCQLRPLYGSLPFAAQRAAIAPVSEGRKIVLSTSIAETSLTIEDIRAVVDAGRARRARYDPNSGMSRLVTERVSRAEAAQRAGRAGRVAEGLCYRAWTKGEEGALPAFPPAEIESADLAGFALELALWGADRLPFLTEPPAGALAEARALLRALGALDAQDRITAHGRAVAAQPIHPRLAHMLQIVGAKGANLAALLSERDVLSGAPSDLGLRLRALGGRYDGPGSVNIPARDRVRSESLRLAKGLSSEGDHTSAEQAALAYPDRIGRRRPGDEPRYLLSGGKGAIFDRTDPLAAQDYIIATDLDGDPREARIRQAIAISESEIRATFADRITWSDSCEWSRRDRRVVARRSERLGAIELDGRTWTDAPQDAVARAMCAGVRDVGLRLEGPARRFRARVELVRAGGDELPAMDDDSLLTGLETWLAPHLGMVRTADDWKRFNPLDALRSMLDWAQTQRLDSAAPAHFTTPLGRKIPIDYDGEAPEISLRIQEMFGVTDHPRVGKTPLRVTLLSPGQKPVQTTTDIPGFWDTSYADVRKDMRGRYPRHPWPENPREADPTLRAKPRGT